MRGWQIAKPFGHAQTYDFVCKFKDAWETVQVKTAFEEKGGLVVGVRRSRGRKYESGQMDWLFVVHAPDYWLIPWAALSGFSSQICVGAEKWRQYKLPQI